jgi:CRISPR-associated protein Cst2
VNFAKKEGLEHLAGEKSYRLTKEQRLERVVALLDGLSQLEGGAKLTQHYTDVNPPFVILAATKGGNHIFGRVIGANRGNPVVNTDALAEAINIFSDQVLSQVYVGWTQGYMDDERARFENWKSAYPQICVDHPRIVYQKLVEELKSHLEWLD